MLILGIDPGTAICGYGLVDMTGNRLRPVFYGSVLTDKDMLPELRLKKIFEELNGLIADYKPDFMSVEKLYFNRNVNTAGSLGGSIAGATAGNVAGRAGRLIKSGFKKI